MRYETKKAPKTKVAPKAKRCSPRYRRMDAVERHGHFQWEQGYERARFPEPLDTSSTMEDRPQESPAVPAPLNGA